MRFIAIFILASFSFRAFPQPLHYNSNYFIYPEVAAFPGGHDSLLSFIVKLFVQPEIVPDSSFTLKGRIKFAVEKNGLAGQFEILQQLGFNCDEEMIRVLKLARWEPAVYKGITTKEIHVLPVTIIFEKSLNTSSDTSPQSVPACPPQMPWVIPL